MTGKESKMYYVYILTNKYNRVLYTGVTNNEIRREHEHIEGLHNGFTKRYNAKKLVYYECFGQIKDAIAREKYIKGKKRAWKISLIEEKNPTWENLSDMAAGVR